MFFKKQDRQLLKLIFAKLQNMYMVLESVDFKLNIIKNSMATRKELDKALESEKEEIRAAAERHEKVLATKMEEMQNALNNLMSKHDEQEDFSAELEEVQQHMASLKQLAAIPLAQIATGEPLPTAPGTNLGAAGATIGGAQMHDAAVAEGAEEPDGHAASAVMPHGDTETGKEEEAEPVEESEPADKKDVPPLGEIAQQ